MAGVGEEEVGLSRELSDYKPANELIVVDCSKGWKNLLCVEYPGNAAMFVVGVVVITILPSL